MLTPLYHQPNFILKDQLCTKCTQLMWKKQEVPSSSGTFLPLSGDSLSRGSLHAFHRGLPSVELTSNYWLQSFSFCCYKCYVKGKDTSTGQQEEILKLNSQCIEWIKRQESSGIIFSSVLSDTDNRSKNICSATATVAFKIFLELNALLSQGFRFVSDLLLEIYY